MADVGNIYNLLYLKAAIFQSPAQNIRKNIRAEIANVRVVIDGGAAVIKLGYAIFNRLEGLDFSCQSIVELWIHRPIIQERVIISEMDPIFEFAKKHGALLAIGGLIAIGSFYIGWSSGERSASLAINALENRSEGQPEEVDFAPFWKAWNILSEKYVPASTTAESVTDQEKVYGAIKGLAESFGDPYTVFFPPVEAELFEADIRGNFEGVGMEIHAEEGAIVVVSPLKGSPAEKAGLEPGDKIVSINDQSTASLSTEDAVKIIRGPKGTPVTFTVFREGLSETFEVKVVRDVINVPTIATKQERGVFIIELYSFTANSPELFRGALREFIISGSDKLVLDLRGNPGGYLEAAIDMASWFLPPSAVVVKEDFGGNGREQAYRSRGYNVFDEDLKFAIIVDRGSASASEILAGALKEQGRAVLVGEKTFGKGSVQELVDITDDTSLKVTIARWLTPNGNSISENGVEPDYPVEYTEEDRKAGRDPALEKAIEVLNQ